MPERERERAHTKQQCPVFAITANRRTFEQLALCQTVKFIFNLRALHRQRHTHNRASVAFRRRCCNRNRQIDATSESSIWIRIFREIHWISVSFVQLVDFGTVAKSLILAQNMLSVACLVRDKWFPMRRSFNVLSFPNAFRYCVALSMFMPTRRTCNFVCA